MIEVEVVGVRIEMPSNQPIVLLKEIQGQQFLPIWVGAVEATAIAFAQQGVEPPRPLTHDLMATMIDLLGATLERVVITQIVEGVFYADLHLHLKDRQTKSAEIVISARPSDALALALRSASSIWVSDELMAAAGIEIPEHEGGKANEEVERFREFLDQINPEDFLR